jgi:hypothetical protein
LVFNFDDAAVPSSQTAVGDGVRDHPSSSRGELRGVVQQSDGVRRGEERRGEERSREERRGERT